MHKKKVIEEKCFNHINIKMLHVLVLHTSFTFTFDKLCGMT